MTPGISLIVGLGNPGVEYAQTRHNAGFRFIEALLAGSESQSRPDGRFSGSIAKQNIGDKSVWLLTPTNFMNRSGDSVASFSRYYKIPAAEILVAYDELDLPPGTVRLKQNGGDAGHNGLHDVIGKLGTQDFFRLRLGVGHPGSSRDVTSYLLKKAPPSEQAMIDTAINNARDNIVDIVHGRMQQAMNVLHRQTK